MRLKNRKKLFKYSPELNSYSSIINGDHRHYRHHQRQHHQQQQHLQLQHHQYQQQHHFQQQYNQHLQIAENSKTLNSFGRYFAIAILIILSVLCFYNSYDGDFVFDDQPAILTNKVIRESKKFSDFFIHDFWGQPIRLPQSHKSFRPLTTITFA